MIVVCALVQQEYSITRFLCTKFLFFIWYCIVVISIRLQRVTMHYCRAFLSPSSTASWTTRYHATYLNTRVARNFT